MGVNRISIRNTMWVPKLRLLYSTQVMLFGGDGRSQMLNDMFVIEGKNVDVQFKYRMKYDSKENTQWAKTQHPLIEGFWKKYALFTPTLLPGLNPQIDDLKFVYFYNSPIPRELDEYEPRQHP